jgi:predicted AlkP superfamily phosphohydrolase/phosphomutase
MRSLVRLFLLVSLLLPATLLPAQSTPAAPTAPQAKKPRVIIIGVNGAEWDILRPLLMRGELPNLQKVINNGVSGKLQTVSAPNCPKVYSTFFTSVPPAEHGITGFLVGGQTANTNMLKKEPIWSILSKHDVTVGMANVPATFPVMPVNGYMVSGMLTRGKDCEDGVMCAPKLSQVEGGDAVYPASLKSELESKIGDFYIDCARMPSAEQLQGHETEVVKKWLAQVQLIRDQQTKLFDYLLTNHPTDFTFMVQSCEDRTGHWLYPIQPYNVGYNAKVASVDVNAFPDQYRAFDKVLGMILTHVDENTYLFMIADHGIKPLRYPEDPHMHMDHGGTTPVIAKHDYMDGDDVPGVFIAMGPGIKKGVQLMGFKISAYDVAPTILHIYGIQPNPDMKGHVASVIFEGGDSSMKAEMQGQQMDHMDHQQMQHH